MKMRLTGGKETSLLNHLTTRNSPQDDITHFSRGWSLRLRKHKTSRSGLNTPVDPASGHRSTAIFFRHCDRSTCTTSSSECQVGVQSLCVLFSLENKWKGRVFQVHAVKTYDIEVKLHSFLSSALVGRSVVNLTPQPLNPRGKEPWYPWNRKLGGPQNRSGRFG